jgi:hypothetical protein
MKSDKRTDPRRPEDHRVCIVARGKTYGNATITDLSGSGAQLNLASSRAVPNAFTMILSYTPKIARECTVVWQRGRDIGVKFVEQARPGRPLKARPASADKVEAAE